MNHYGRDDGEAAKGVEMGWMVESWDGGTAKCLQCLYCVEWSAFVGGAVAFGSAVGVLKATGDRLHIDAIRMPMMMLALLGSVVNLATLWQVWRLRRRSASAWRVQAVPASKKRAEWIQFALAVLTLVLLAVEEWAHWKLQGRG